MTSVPAPGREYPLLIGGAPEVGGGSPVVVRAPFDDRQVGIAASATKEDVLRAIDAAHEAAPQARALPSFRRAQVLQQIHDNAAARRGELAVLLALEAGKPIGQARLEVDRTLFVFRDAAEEAMRIGGEVLPLDRMPHGKGRWGITRRFPLAPVAGIVPFNFPLLLTAHKIAPALACGATIVLKTPPQDPLAVLLLGELIGAAGYPEGGVSVLHCSVEDATPLLDDPRVRMVTFTGSARAGWQIRERAARKKVALELGGNAGVIIERDADLELAATRCAAGGFAFAGQSCISVQRILVQHAVFRPFMDRLLPKVAALRTGDPLDEHSDLGPMIDEPAAMRAEAWVREAIGQGAKLAIGGQRSGSILQPTVLLETTAGMRVNCEEVFAPVVTVRPYTDFDEALYEVNASPYGLQAGLFTASLERMWHAFETLEVGGLAANEISGFRVDHMPYGGVKGSGLGREGVRYAIEEMTEPRLLML